MQFPNFQSAIVAINFGMAVYPVQNYATVVVAQIYAVLYWDLYRVVYLHIYIVATAPIPSPTIFTLVKDGGGRDHSTAALKIYVDFIQLALYLIFVVPSGLDMDFNSYLVLVPGGDI